jgi:hypothetical protein
LELNAVKKHTFYTSAVLLATIALVLNMIGRDRFVQASRHKAQHIGAAQGQHTTYVMDSESARLVQSGRVLTTVGVTLAFFGMGSTIVALIRREGGWYLILAGLLLSDIVAVMLL